MLACSRGYPVRLSQGDVRGPLTRFLMPVGPYRCGRDAEVDSVGDAGKVTVCTALHGSGPVSAIAVLNRRDTLTALFLHFAGGADSIAQHTTYDSLAAALDAQLGKGTWCGHAQEWWAHQRWWHGAGWSLTLQARGPPHAVPHAMLRATTRVPDDSASCLNADFQAGRERFAPDSPVAWRSGTSGCTRWRWPIVTPPDGRAQWQPPSGSPRRPAGHESATPATHSHRRPRAWPRVTGWSRVASRAPSASAPPPRAVRGELGSMPPSGVRRRWPGTGVVDTGVTDS